MLEARAQTSAGLAAHGFRVSANGFLFKRLNPVSQRRVAGDLFESGTRQEGGVRWEEKRRQSGVKQGPEGSFCRWIAWPRLWENIFSQTGIIRHAAEVADAAVSVTPACSTPCAVQSPRGEAKKREVSLPLAERAPAPQSFSCRQRVVWERAQLEERPAPDPETPILIPLLGEGVNFSCDVM
jgi:hypothetical protein